MRNRYHRSSDKIGTYLQRIDESMADVFPDVLAAGCRCTPRKESNRWNIQRYVSYIYLLVINSLIQGCNEVAYVIMML